MGITVVSHVVPFPSPLDVSLALFPWAMALVMILLGYSPRLKPLRTTVRLDAMTFLFALVIAIGWFAATHGNVSEVCSRPTCIKLDEYRASQGRYFRYRPAYTCDQGCVSSGWTEISRRTYIEEVGTRLRDAAGFGLWCLCGGWLLTWKIPRWGWRGS
jgi:hypothetical protein